MTAGGAAVARAVRAAFFFSESVPPGAGRAIALRPSVAQTVPSSGWCSLRSHLARLGSSASRCARVRLGLATRFRRQRHRRPQRNRPPGSTLPAETWHSGPSLVVV